MPQFNPSPFASPVVQLQPGVTEYLLGRRTQYVADTRFNITGVVDDGTTATFSGNVTEGNPPIVGASFSTVTSNATYNVVSAAITAVTFDANGNGSITIASVATGTLPITGTAIVPVPEIPETAVNGASISAVVPLSGSSAISRKLMAEVTFPTVPSAAQVFLQGAMRNIDSEFTDIVQVGTVAAGAVTATTQYIDAQGMFYRFRVAGVSGSGTVTAKVVC